MYKHILLILLFIPLAQAETIHDEWHAYQDFFTIDDDYYEVTTELIKGSKSTVVSALIQKNQHKYILTAPTNIADNEYYITKETCKDEGYYSYCIKNISVQPEKGARADEYGNYRYGVQVAIYKDNVPTANINIVKEIESTTLAYNEEMKVTLRITNDGEEKATNIILNETIGPGLAIQRFEGFDLWVGNVLKANKILELHEEEELVYRYWVKATDYINTSFAATKIEYEDPLLATTSQNTSFSITWPFTASLTLNPTSMTLGQDSDLTFTLKNNEQKEMDMNVNIDLPFNLIAYPDKNFEYLPGKKLYFSKTLDPLESITLKADLDSPYTGSYPLTTTLTTTVNDQSFSWGQEDTLTVNHEKITPTLHLNKDKVQSLEYVTFTAYLENEDDTLAFLDINGVISSEFFEDEIHLDSIAAGKQSENVLFKKYRMPVVDRPTTYLIFFNGTFDTIGQETFTFSTQRELTVLPENQTLIHTVTLDKTQANTTDVVTVTVEAENLLDSIIIINAKDSFPQGIKKTFGDALADVTLQPLEKKQLYVYKVSAPETWEENDFSIISEIYSEDQLLSEIIKTVDILDPYVPSIASQEENTTTTNTSQTNQTTQDTQSTNQEQNNNVKIENESFFSRIITGVTDFFASLFS